MHQLLTAAEPGEEELEGSYYDYFSMMDKGNQSNQSRRLSIRIANIKFSVLHRVQHKKSTSNSFLQNTQKQPEPSTQEEKSRTRALSRNSFIPSTCIRSKAQVDRTRQFINTPLFPADVTYSKFPLRPPKSLKPRAYFPIFRERIVSCQEQPQRALNLSQQSFENRQIKHKRSRTMHSRTATKSCLVLNQTEKERETFVRYSHINSQDCSELKVSTERHEEQQPSGL